MSLADQTLAALEGDTEDLQALIDAARLNEKLGIRDIATKELLQRLGMTAETRPDHLVYAPRFLVTPLSLQRNGEIGPGRGKAQGVGRRLGFLEDLDDGAAQRLGFAIAPLLKEHPH